MLIETYLESQLPTFLAVFIILYSYMLICVYSHLRSEGILLN